MKLFKIVLVSSALFLTGVAVAGGEEIVNDAKNICVGCHSVDNKLVGPSYKEIAAFYKNDATKADEIAAKIKGGSSGSFGPIPMPANPVITLEDAKVAAEYILGLK